MSVINRPKIDMKISTWELILSGVHLFPLIVLVAYYIREWHTIPGVIPGLSYREGEKTSFFGVRILLTFVIISSSIHTILSSPRNKYFKGRSVSRDLHKAMMQYRIEASWWLCLTISIHILFLTANIIYVETYIKKNHVYISWWPQYFIAMVATWLIHHILWTRFADK
jgi:hypothetical protein